MLERSAVDPGGAEKRTLSERAYEEISGMLLSGQLRPGERLTLRQLMAALDLSSTPIRDAIRQLAAENALDFVPNRHIRVPELQVHQLRELRDIRVMLEGSAVEIAAAAMPAATIGALKTIDQAIRDARNRGDIPEAMREIYRFHFTLYQEARREHLLGLIRGLWLRVAPYRSLLFPQYSQMERGNLRLMIIGALERKDGPSARMLMQADTTGAMNHIIEQVEARGRERGKDGV